MKIQSRLFRLVFVAWLPAALAIGIIARSTYVDQESAALEEVRKLADNVGVIVERELDTRAVMARTLSASSALESEDLGRFYGEAATATRGSGSWSLLVTPTHQVLNTVLAFQPGLSVPRVQEAPWLPSGEGVFFSMHGPLVDKPIITAYVAQPGRPARYNVGIAFDPSVIQAIVSRQVPPHGAVVTVMDQQLRVVARSRSPQTWIGRHATGPLQDRAMAKHEGFAPSVTLDKVPSLTYLSRPNRYGWYVVVAVPTAAMDRQASRAVVDAVSLAAILLGSSLLCALYIARTISQPVLDLKDAADVLGQDLVPSALNTGLFETDEVAKALRAAGLRARESADVLEARVQDAVARTAQVQERLAAAEKHEAVGRLAGGIAHDFNNLLQTISTALHLLGPTTPEGPPKRMLEAATRASGKASGLVRQMLAFGRVQPLKPEPVDLHDFLLKASELTSKAAGANIALHAVIPPGLPAVYADPTQLELALLNLIFNARDAMEGQGHIEIRASLMEVSDAGLPSTPAFSHCVRLEVQDDGPGMDAGTLHKAFDPYFTTKPVGSGSGLGLPQVLAFARQSGGDARILSEVGVGTTVQLLLPITTQSALVSPEKQRNAQAPARPLHVLMVEDDPLVSSVVAPALRHAGHSVTQCVNADEAKAMLSRNGVGAFDVVFSDVVMPGTMTGFDLLQWCRAQAPDLPVVLATGYSAQAPQTDATLLRKPYHIDELLDTLQQVAGELA